MKTKRKSDLTTQRGDGQRRTRRPSESVRQRQVERRAEVLKAARTILDAEGDEAITAKRLAHELGVVPAALYRTVSSLDVLKGALMIESLDELGLDIDAAVRSVPQKSRRGRARINVAIDAFVSLAERAPGAHRLIDRALSSPVPFYDDETAHAVEGALTRALHPVVRALDEGVDVGEFIGGDNTARAMALLAFVHGVGHFQKRDRLLPARLRAETVRRIGIDAFLDGISPKVK